MTLFSKMCGEVDGVVAELDAVVRPDVFPVVFSRRNRSRTRASFRQSSFSLTLIPPFLVLLPLFPKASATSTSALERRDRATMALARLEEAAPQVEKMRKTAAEPDKEKRIYNETMTAKVLALADRLAATREKAIAVQASLKPLAEAEAAQAKAKADAERVAAQAEAAKKAEEEAAAKAELEAAAAAQAKEEEEAKRVRAEREAARVKAEEEATANKAQTAAAAAAEAKAKEEAAETERQRRAEEARAKKAALAARVAASTPVTPSTASPETAPIAPATAAATSQVSTTPPSTAVEANAAALASMLASMSPLGSSPAPVGTPAGTPAGTSKTWGEVRHVTGGANELRSTLEEASAAVALTVVDWSIPTCGPCQRIRPAYQAMAANRPGVLFVGVDAHASAENAQLARSAAVRAYPTFHLYVNMRRVAEMSGADESRLASLVTAHAPAPASSASQNSVSVPGSTDASTGDMQNAIASALQTLRGACSSLPEFITATKTLLTFVGNVLDNPSEAKYRKVRVANPGFNAKLGRLAGGIDAMQAFGFAKEEDGEDAVLVMSENSAKHPGLPAMRALLQQAVPR